MKHLSFVLWLVMVDSPKTSRNKVPNMMLWAATVA